MGKERRRTPSAAARGLIACALVFSCAGGTALAESELSGYHPQGSMLRKLERGGTNLGLGWMEMFRHFRQPDHGEWVMPWVVGAFKGVYYSTKRTFAGLYEVITFPVEAPEDYLPVIEPEFVWNYPPRALRGRELAEAQERASQSYPHQV